MTDRIVSKASQKRLAKLLAGRVSCEKLADVFGRSFAESGSTEESLLKCIRDGADLGLFTLSRLEQIENEIAGDFHPNFQQIAIAMELMPAEKTLLGAADLERIKSLVSSSKARLYESSRLTRIRKELHPDLLENASTAADDDREQLRAWLDAANRQVEEAAWMTRLVQVAANACDDDPTRDALRSVHQYLTAHEPTAWKLAFLETAPAAAVAPPAPDVPPAPTGPPKQGIALAIGISNYERAKAAEGGRPLLTNLTCAAQDARDVADFLREQQDIDFSGRVECLVDEQATLRGILHGVDALRAQCVGSEERDPLVVVYFSGHGMPDAVGRHYLVPYDADPEDLFSTALWNKTFKAALEQIETRRLVVLLDACHAQAMLPPGTKDGTALFYDPLDSSNGLQMGHGYVIASCATGKRSFEAERNGVFTQTLLALLRFDDIDQEELDLADLYGYLRKRVDAAARRLTKGGSQIPTANIPVGSVTGVIVAVNRRREKTQKRFLDSVSNYLHKHKPPQWATIEMRLTELQASSATSEIPREYEMFWSLFVEAAVRWQESQDERGMSQLCKDLAKQLGVREQGSATPERQPQDKLSGARRLLDLGAGQAVSGLPAQDLQAGSAPTAFPLSPQPAQEFRVLAPQDVIHVLDCIPKETDYLATITRLEALLSKPQGVSEAQFFDAVRREHGQIRKGAAQGADTDAERAQVLEQLESQLECISQDLATRFKKAWKAASRVTAFSLRAQSGS